MGRVRRCGGRGLQGLRLLRLRRGRGRLLRLLRRGGRLLLGLHLLRGWSLGGGVSEMDILDGRKPVVKICSYREALHFVLQHLVRHRIRRRDPRECGMRLVLGHHRLKRIAVFVLDAGHRSCEFLRMGSRVVGGESKAAYLHMIAIEQFARRCTLCFGLHEQVFLPRSRVCLCQDSEARQPANRFFSFADFTTQSSVALTCCNAKREAI